MSLWKRNNVYWSYVYIDGVRYSQSTGTGNRRKAELIDQRFREELNLQRHHIREPILDMRFSELAARFLAEADPKPWHVDRLKHLLPYWGEIPIGRIHKTIAVDYRKCRHSEKPLTDATINRDLGVLRHILFWAVDQGFLLSNPLARLRLVKERRKPRSVVGVAEEQKLLAAAAPHMYAIIVTALDTGMRRGELLQQRWEHVDLTRRLLFVSCSKTAEGEGREIPLTERVYALLAANRQRQGVLFTYRGRAIARIKTAWKATIRRAEIRYYRFHDLRHTFNTRLMEAGVLQEIRKELMGHSSGRDVNSIYTHIELPAKREAIRKLEAWMATQTTNLHTQGEKDDRSTEGNGVPSEAASAASGTEAMEEEDSRGSGA